MAQRAKVRRQIRSFVIVWTLLTLVMGAATFAGIYIAYGTLDTTSLRLPASNVALPLATSTMSTRTSAAVVVIPSSTPLPTRPATEVPPTEEEEPTAPPPPTATPTPLPVDVDEFEPGIQVQVSYDLMEAWLDVASDQLGLPWVKQQVRWEDIEKAEDEYDWTVTDIYLPTAAEEGLRVMISVVTAPDWAREPGVFLGRHGPPADPQDYADFVGKILERYPGMVHGVEVWNEMNLDREWTSTRGLSAQAYVELLRVTYEKVKSIDPGIIVVSGALSPTGFDDGVSARDDAVFMDLLIGAGMLNYTDCVGAHHNGINVPPDVAWNAVPNDPAARFRGPFDNPHRSWSFYSTLQSYALKVENAGGDQKLCVTEFGWASVEDIGAFPPGFEFAADNSLVEQRDYIIRALDLMDEWGTVRLAFIWNLNYAPQAGWDPNNDNVPYSLIGPNNSFRPAFDAIREWTDERYGDDD